MVTYTMYVQIYFIYIINSLINLLNMFTMHATWSPILWAIKPLQD